MTPSFLTGAGLVAAATAAYTVLTQTRLVEGAPVGGLVEFLLLAVPAVGLLAAGYWLRAGGFDAEDVRRIGRFSLGGTLIAAAVTVGALAASMPGLDAGSTFVLLVGTSTEGSLLGVLVGTFVVTGGLFRRERAAAAEFETLHALLRHDIRNRLTLIGGHLTLLAESTDVPEEHVSAIEAQVDAIDRLLDDTDVAAEALRGRPALEPVDLVAVVRNQLALLRESYDGVAVTTELPDAAWVTADDLLASVVDNLLTNAVSHHDRPDPELAVSVAVEGDRVRLAIADDGPGIPPERREEVFEAGVGDGTGMGLYLVETVVERYGGAVALDGNEPRGAVTSVTLPRAET